MAEEPGKRPTIDELTPEQAEQEAEVRAQLRDLADLRISEDQEISHVSRRPDDGRLWISCSDGEIVYIDSEIVDTYLRMQPAQRATLKRERSKLSSDMFSRGKLDAFQALAPRTLDDLEPN
jgi:hypothetical protein